MLDQVYRFVGTYDLDRRISFYNRMADLFGVNTIDELTDPQLEIIVKRMSDFLSLEPTVAVLIASCAEEP